MSVQEAVLTGRIGCGMTEGQVISSKPAYGGSNYVNSSYALMYEMNSGERSGSGIGELHSKAIGYQESLDLAGVTATDFAAPGKISDQVTKEPLMVNQFASHGRCRAIMVRIITIKWNLT